MKVKELQEQLGKLDPELDVLCYSDDENLVTEKREFVLFDVLVTKKTEAERTRLDDDVPYLKFGNSPMSDTIAILEVTSDF